MLYSVYNLCWEPRNEMVIAYQHQTSMFAHSHFICYEKKCKHNDSKYSSLNSSTFNVSGLKGRILNQQCTYSWWETVSSKVRLIASGTIDQQTATTLTRHTGYGNSIPDRALHLHTYTSHLLWSLYSSSHNWINQTFLCCFIFIQYGKY